MYQVEAEPVKATTIATSTSRNRRGGPAVANTTTTSTGSRSLPSHSDVGNEERTPRGAKVAIGAEDQRLARNSTTTTGRGGGARKGSYKSEVRKWIGTKLWLASARG